MVSTPLPFVQGYPLIFKTFLKADFEKEGQHRSDVLETKLERPD